MIIRKALVAAVLTFFAGHASATLYEFRADQFAHGTNVSEASPGILLSALQQREFAAWDPTRAPIYSRDCSTNDFYCGSHTGTSTFVAPQPGHVGFSDLTGYRNCLSGLILGCWGVNLFEMQFAQPTDYLRLETTFASDPGGFIAYDLQGNEILSCTVDSCGTVTTGPHDPAGLHFSMFEVQREVGDIARVVFGGVDGVARIGAVSYNTVPEPGTIALLFAGLLGCAISRRRSPAAAN